MTDQHCVLGLDTSNYTTSAAVVSKSGEVMADIRKLLSVKKGERGLRQSEALFQHVKNLPEVFEKLSGGCGCIIDAVCASERPRPVEGSYMPCFLAGSGFGKSAAELMKVPYFSTTHQEGHIEALLGESGFSRDSGFLCFHLSGGTCELLKVKGSSIDIVGGSRDISFGQLIDRSGVALGMDFPAGKEMDDIAFGNETFGPVKKIKVNDGITDLSGTETAVKRLIERGAPKDELVGGLFAVISRAVTDICRDGVRKTGIKDVMLAGGVSTSRTIRKQIQKSSTDLNIWISEGDRGRDNAVGTALIGRRMLWE